MNSCKSQWHIKTGLVGSDYRQDAIMNCRPVSRIRTNNNVGFNEALMFLFVVHAVVWETFPDQVIMKLNDISINSAFCWVIVLLANSSSSGVSALNRSIEP